MELLDRIAAHAVHQGRALAVRQVDAVGDEGTLTYAQLHTEIGRLSGQLRNRFDRGSVLMLLCGNRPGFWVSYFSVLAAGLSVFPASPDMVEAELASSAAISGAAGVIAESVRVPGGKFKRESDIAVGPGLRLWLKEEESPRQEGAGLLLQSSGTTGQSKIVWRSAQALDRMGRSLCDRIGFEPHDRILTGMPLGHSYGGEHGVLAPAWGGASVHVCSGVKLPLIARELRESGITMLPGVPFLFEMMAQTSEAIGRLAHLRHAFSAGAQLPLPVYEAFANRYGLAIGQIYGATEIGSVTFNDPSREGFDPQSVGLPLEGVRICIIDTERADLANPLPAGAEGQVAVQTPTMLSHLVGRDCAALVDGFVLTGDLGRLDALGALTITGRLRLLIDVGGRKVNPVEVEQVLRLHPLVAECAVVATKASLTVCRLKAVVVPRQAPSATDAEALRTFARQRLSAYKVPRMIDFRAALPKTPLGKIQRHLLEEL